MPKFKQVGTSYVRSTFVTFPAFVIFVDAVAHRGKWSQYSFFLFFLSEIHQEIDEILLKYTYLNGWCKNFRIYLEITIFTSLTFVND